ncbi:O-fucosyltransferase 31-like [Malus sylvestris]|uniref:O-fucosyltransferase 31-like n=1 Tax=Malus sylvestris TaxID=3752 RepID=UPI0021AD24AB|nr:O-fucosyltransferase 31-like [Malus sylvestris]
MENAPDSSTQLPDELALWLAVGLLLVERLQEEDIVSSERKCFWAESILISIDYHFLCKHLAFALMRNRHIVLRWMDGPGAGLRTCGAWRAFYVQYCSVNRLYLHSVDQQSKLWAPLPNHGWKHCPEEPNSLSSSPKESTGYIQVFLDEGLNQQKMGICDAVAVAVAKILNATLVIPHLEVNPVWQDSSSFEDIFDVDHFIEALQGEVSIVKALPSEFSWSTREYYATGIRITRIKTAPVHASSDWYLENVLPLLQRYGVAAISPFSHRLAFDNLPQNIQRVSCKVNFQALAFVPHIRELGETLVNRLRYPPNGNPKGGSDSQDKANEIEKQGSGKYVVLHLRFNKDIAAHSACDFGGGKAEKLALAKYRQVIWQGRVLNSQFTDEELRNQGRCPLTPEEIGLLLAALGFNNTTRLYLASYKPLHK